MKNNSKPTRQIRIDFDQLAKMSPLSQVTPMLPVKQNAASKASFPDSSKKLLLPETNMQLSLETVSNLNKQSIEMRSIALYEELILRRRQELKSYSEEQHPLMGAAINFFFDRLLKVLADMRAGRLEFIFGSDENCKQKISLNDEYVVHLHKHYLLRIHNELRIFASKNDFKKMVETPQAQRCLSIVEQEIASKSSLISSGTNVIQQLVRKEEEEIEMRLGKREGEAKGKLLEIMEGLANIRRDESMRSNLAAFERHKWQREQGKRIYGEWGSLMPLLFQPQWVFQ